MDDPSLFARLKKGISLQQNLARDVPAFLNQHGFPHTAAHAHQVALKARWLAGIYGVDQRAAETAGWLHDISAVIPNEQRLPVSQQLGLEILAEEARFPMLLHQKISARMAEEIFGVHQPEVLQAIECHTTLRANPGPLDLVLFVADKIAWDQPGEPPYLEAVLRALPTSLQSAALVYIDFLWERKDQLAGPLHPWFLAARRQLHSGETP